MSLYWKCISLAQNVGYNCYGCVTLSFSLNLSEWVSSRTWKYK